MIEKTKKPIVYKRIIENTTTILGSFENKDDANTLRNIILQEHRSLSPNVYVIVTPTKTIEDDVEVVTTTYELGVSNVWGTRFSASSIEPIETTALNYLDSLTAPQKLDITTKIDIIDTKVSENIECAR